MRTSICLPLLLVSLVACDQKGPDARPDIPSAASSQSIAEDYGTSSAPPTTPEQRFPDHCADNRPSCGLYAAWENLIEHGVRDPAAEAQLRVSLQKAFADESLQTIEAVACSEKLCRVIMRGDDDTDKLLGACSSCTLHVTSFSDPRGPVAYAYFSKQGKTLPDLGGNLAEKVVRVERLGP